MSEEVRKLSLASLSPPPHVYCSTAGGGGGASVTDEKIGGTYNSFLSPPTDIHKKKKKKKKKKEFKHERKRIKTTKSSAYILAAPDLDCSYANGRAYSRDFELSIWRLKETVCASI